VGEERGCVPRSGISRSNVKRSKNIINDWNRRAAAADAPHSVALHQSRISPAYNHTRPAGAHLNFWPMDEPALGSEGTNGNSPAVYCRVKVMTYQVPEGWLKRDPMIAID
jgi:hypothetical protein